MLTENDYLFPHIVEGGASGFERKEEELLPRQQSNKRGLRSCQENKNKLLRQAPP